MLRTTNTPAMTASNARVSGTARGGSAAASSRNQAQPTAADTELVELVRAFDAAQRDARGRRLEVYAEHEEAEEERRIESRKRYLWNTSRVQEIFGGELRHHRRRRRPVARGKLRQPCTDAVGNGGDPHDGREEDSLVRDAAEQEEEEKKEATRRTLETSDAIERELANIITDGTDRTNAAFTTAVMCDKVTDLISAVTTHDELAAMVSMYAPDAAASLRADMPTDDDMRPVANRRRKRMREDFDESDDDGADGGADCGGAHDRDANGEEDGVDPFASTNDMKTVTATPQLPPSFHVRRVNSITLHRDFLAAMHHTDTRVMQL